MKLHVFPASPNAKKVMFANAHMGLNIPIEMVNLQEGAHQSTEYLALNPNGKVPTLEFDDGSTLWESNVIMNRLASDAKSDLWPADMSRYEIMRWQFWEACHWTPACAKYISRHLFNNESVDMAAADTDFHRFAKVLDDHLNGRDWLVGESMTNADIAVSQILCYREPCQYPVADYANINRWINTIEATDAWAAANPPMPG